MHFSQLLTIVSLSAAAVNGMQYANPFVKHAARAVAVDGNMGAMFKRQTSCPDGLTACGTGCSDGPCCDSSKGLACRSGEVCSTVNNQVACCAEGYTCGAVRDCESAYGTGCTPGAVKDGHLCCDAIAPMCNTASGTPYCSGAAVSTTYLATPQADSQPTSTQSITETSTATVIVAPSTSTIDMTSTQTSTVLISAAPESMSTVTSSTATMTSTVVLPYVSSGASSSGGSSPSQTVVVVVPLPSYGSVIGTTTMSVISGSSTYVAILTQYANGTMTGISQPSVPTTSESITSTSTSTVYAIQTINPTSALSNLTTTSSSTYTSTSTAFLTVYPVPTYNGTYPGGGANATATGLPAPTQAIGGAGRLGVNTGCALVGVMGLMAFLL